MFLIAEPSSFLFHPQTKILFAIHNSAYPYVSSTSYVGSSLRLAGASLPSPSVYIPVRSLTLTARHLIHLATTAVCDACTPAMVVQSSPCPADDAVPAT